MGKSIIEMYIGPFKREAYLAIKRQILNANWSMNWKCA